jgi:DNA-binding MarR family transcriptional regulator
MVPIDRTRGCLNFQLRRTSRLLGRYYDDALRPIGLRITQFNILAVLAQTGPIAITALAEVLGLERSALARNLKPITRKKFVILSTGSDKRTRIVKLAHGGKLKLDEALPKWDYAQRQLVKDLGHSRAVALGQTLSKIRTALGKHYYSADNPHNIKRRFEIT